MEVDLVAESSDGTTLLVGEAKLSLLESEAGRILAELDEKARNLPFASNYAKIVTRLFVAQNPPPGAVSLDWCEE
jgi:hypothetical protein